MLSSISKDFVHIAQETFQHACELFTKSTESDSTLSSLPQSLPPDTPSQHRQPIIAHASSDAISSDSASMKPSSHFKKRFEKLIEGTFDSGIPITSDEDDDDEPQEIPPPTSNIRTRTTTDVSRTRGSARHQTSRFEKEQEQDFTEIPSPYFQDPHAVSGNARRTNRNNMPYGYGGPKPNFGLRFTNTLEQANTSSKSQHYNAKTQLNAASSSGLRVTQKPRPQATPQYIEDDTPPSKRRRIGATNEKGGNHVRDTANSRSRNEDIRPNDPPTPKSDLASAYGVEDLGPRGMQSNGVRDTALRKMSLKYPVPNENRRKTQRSSPDYLTSEMHSGGHDGENFMRSARQERESRASDSDEEHHHQDISISRKTSKHLNHSPVREGPIQLPRPNRPASSKNTPRISKIASRLNDQSPDILHTSAQTSVKPFKPFASPSRSPPISTRTSKFFPLRRFVCAGLPEAEAEAYRIEVDDKKREFSILYKNPELTTDPIFGPIPVPKIIRIFFSSDEDTNFVILKFSDGVLSGSQCSLDFGESRKTFADFLNVIDRIDSNIKMFSRDSAWMSNASALTILKAKGIEQVQASRAERVEQPLRQATTGPHVQQKSANLQNGVRVRKVDQLDTSPTHQVFQGEVNGKTSRKPTSIDHHDNTRTTQLTIAPLPGRTRETRSKVSQRPPEEAGIDTISIDVEPRRTGTPWKKPLIYPKDGKSRATVTWEDLERLNDDEFLNDNLIGLFMRYLQEHMGQKHAKTVHLFSSFFYDSLTRPAEKSKSRQINYSAVANWTKTVNLFKRDFVVVPVNESAHWYVMIICNLRTLQEPQDGGQEVADMYGLAEEEEVNLVHDSPKTILESDLGADKEVIEDSDFTEPTSTTKPASAKKRQKLQQRQRKYATHEPVIITLDSLGQPRSGTASALKDYLVEEAKDKYDLVIEKTDFKGMTAKNIPLQNNFSDCGLYLCMYLEQFARDPSAFIKSILQREEKIVPWPKNLKKGVLRERLYEMIQKLYRDQTKTTDPKAEVMDPDLPPIGRILIKDEDYPTVKKTTQPNMYKPENINAGLDYAEKNLSRDDSAGSADRMLLEQNFPNDNGNPTSRPVFQPNRKIEAHGSTSQPIVVEDSQEPILNQDDTSSRFFRGRTEESGLRRTEPRPDTPLALAEQLRQGRSPGHQTTVRPPSTDTSSTIDLTTPLRQLSHNDAPPLEEMERQSRSISCTTDNLIGHHTYRDSTENEGPIQYPDMVTYMSGQQVQVRGQDEDQPMQGTEDDFTVFPDENEVVQSRSSSVVPDSGRDDTPDQMLLD